MKKIFLLIIASFIVSHIVAQQVKITGIVTDYDYGDSMIGCSVTTRGTETIAYADIDGKYTIDAKVGDILEFSYIGYKTHKEKIVSAQTVYNITLEENEIPSEPIPWYGRRMIKEDIVPFHADNVEGKRKMGIKDRAGNILIPAEYDMVIWLRDDIFRIENNEKHELFFARSKLKVPAL